MLIISGSKMSDELLMSGEAAEERVSSEAILWDLELKVSVRSQ